MKATFLKVAVGAALAVGAAPAFANLIYVNGSQTTGTGLGNVSTLVTVQDTGSGRQQNGIESGCVTHTAGGNPARPTQTCQEGLQGGDNTAGNAGNNTYFLSDIDGITNAGELGFIVNVSEPGSDTATLTDLYLSLFNTISNTRTTYSYVGPDLILNDSDNGGIGQSGIYQFIFDDEQAAQARAFCPVLSQCVVGGGVQFAGGTTQGTPETVYVGAFDRDGGGNPGEVPEPASLALMGAGAMALGFLRRRYAGKR